MTKNSRVLPPRQKGKAYLCPALAKTEAGLRFCSHVSAEVYFFDIQDLAKIGGREFAWLE